MNDGVELTVALWPIAHSTKIWRFHLARLIFSRILEGLLFHPGHKPAAIEKIICCGIDESIAERHVDARTYVFIA